MPFPPCADEALFVIWLCKHFCSWVAISFGNTMTADGYAKNKPPATTFVPAAAIEEIIICPARNYVRSRSFIHGTYGSAPT